MRLIINQILKIYCNQAFLILSLCVLYSSSSSSSRYSRHDLLVKSPKNKLSQTRNVFSLFEKSSASVISNLSIIADDNSKPRSDLALFSIRGGGDSKQTIESITGTNPSDEKEEIVHLQEQYHPRVTLYKKCIILVFLWITTGTIFYSIINHPHWSIPTAFFYAVDAGMSIGFCIPEVKETTIRSRAFSILFILIGASVVGGALALFVSDVLDGASDVITRDYRLMLEKDAFERYDTNGDGRISHLEMVGLLEGMGYGSVSILGGGVNNVNAADPSANDGVSREKLVALCDELFHTKSDDKGFTMGDFQGIFQRIEGIIREKQFRKIYPMTPTARRGYGRQRIDKLGGFLQKSSTLYIVFTLWIATGILWGTYTQRWDPITATHFAISALATGGLTAPPVNAQGILPSRTAIFVGFYCLLGIPLFYCVMGHYARTLVSKNLLDMERFIISTPLQPYEYRLVANSLCSPMDGYIHLGDFMVMHFLRRGSTDVNIVRLVRNQFEALDLDKDGVLTFEEATRGLDQFYG